MELRWGRTAVPLSLAFFLMAGCETKMANPSVTDPPSTLQSVQTPQNANETNAATSVNQTNETNPVKTNAASPNDPDAGTTTPEPTNKPKVEPSDNYNASKPTLMGLSLNATKSNVIGKFGEPKSQNMLEDDAGPVQVYRYADFSIGFRPDGKLEYVEVNSNRIDPGLKGLRVGQKTSDAISALGKPNINTGYVLAYESQGAVLKLDIDLTVDTVLSIKLFSAKS